MRDFALLSEGGPKESQSMSTVALFELLARSTWRTIRSTSDNEIRFGEDAITSCILATLASARTNTVVFEDTRNDESLKGCDFELWIGSDSHGWHRYAVQAKKIQVKQGRYSSLNHKVGKKRQIDILMQYASTNSAVPLYCFYNYRPDHVPWNCCQCREDEQIGCSIATANSVRKNLAVKGGMTFTRIHTEPGTLPWRCLIECPSTGSRKTPPDRLDVNPQLVPFLPMSLQRLRERRQVNVPFSELSDVFNPQLGLVPKYVVLAEV